MPYIPKTPGKDWAYVTSGIATVNVVIYLLLSLKGSTTNAFYMASNGAMYPDFLLYKRSHHHSRYLPLHIHLRSKSFTHILVGNRKVYRG